MDDFVHPNLANFLYICKSYKCFSNQDRKVIFSFWSAIHLKQLDIVPLLKEILWLWACVGELEDVL